MTQSTWHVISIPYAFELLNHWSNWLSKCRVFRLLLYVQDKTDGQTFPQNVLIDHVRFHGSWQFYLFYCIPSKLKMSCILQTHTAEKALVLEMHIFFKLSNKYCLQHFNDVTCNDVDDSSNESLSTSSDHAHHVEHGG